jgi:hypothetical protein
VKVEDIRMCTESCRKMEGEEKGKGRAMEGAEQTHSGDTLKHAFEHQLKY